MAGRKTERSRRPRKKAASIRTSSERLPHLRNGLARKYLDIAGVIMVALDRKGRVTMINKRGCELLGYREKGIIGKNWFKTFIPAPERRRVNEVFRHIMAGRMEMATRFDNQVKTKSGGIRLISWRNSVILGPDGKIRSTLSSGEDVTDLRKAEVSLRESEHRFRQMFETSPVGILLSAPDYRFMRANPAACKMFGYSEEELRKMTFKQLTHPAYLTQDIGQMELLKAGQIPLYRTEKRYIRKDGKTIWGLVNVSIIRDEEGRLASFLVMVHDISRRKHAEEQMRLQKEKLEELSQLRERFMADIAHELKTPLSVIMLNLEMMKRLQNKPLCDISPMRGLLWRNAKRISTSVDQIMQLTSIGSVKVRKRRTGVRDLMCGVKDDYAQLAESKGLRLSFKGPKISIYSDPRLLSSAVSNLVSNAIKFTSNGSVDVSWRADGRFIRIEVSDTGIGIRSDNRGRVFEMFFKEDHDAPGSGVGLSLSAEFVKKLGGTLSFTSKPGKGSVFTITIPKM